MIMSVQNDLFGSEVETKGDLFDRFGVPPFSVLDTRQGYWQTGKKQLINKYHLESNNSRIDKTYGCGSYDDFLGKKLKELGTTSIFDPFLCDLLYTRFCPVGGLVFDPFAGGAVRGIIAGKNKINYIGCDIRDDQILENNALLDKTNLEVKPTWICIDSKKYIHKDMYYFVFLCPPYGNLEKYSNLKGDISNMDYSDFILSYQEIIQKTLENLNNNSFSCFVVSNFRNKKGNYNGFVRDTQYIFEDSGCNLYNEFILLNSVGTVRLRVGKQFDATRKCGGVHQNILVFLKGDAKKATGKIKNANKNI